MEKLMVRRKRKVVGRKTQKKMNNVQEEFRNLGNFTGCKKSQAWKFLHFTKNSCLLLFLQNKEHKKLEEHIYERGKKIKERKTKIREMKKSHK